MRRAIALLLLCCPLSAMPAEPSDTRSKPPPKTPPAGLTGDWFGAGPDLREAGVDLRLEWSQFYQHLGRDDPRNDRRNAYGGKWDALLRLDLSRMGIGEGYSLTVQGNFNQGTTLNGQNGSLIPANAAEFFPGIEGSDADDVMALYLQKDFSSTYSLLAGKLNLVEFARGTPLRGGGGVDTFWNASLATPITGVSPPTIYGTQLRINTQPVSYSLTLFDAQDGSNTKLFEHLFDEGTNLMATATLKTSVAGRSGNYGIKGIYSTRRGPDFSQLVESVTSREPLNEKKGSWYGSLSMQQYLVQDPLDPKRGWGVFAELARADGNPNNQRWSTYVGLGGNGLLPGRPDDRFGVAYFRFGVSDDLKDELRSIYPLTDESGIETFYNIAVTPWLRISLDVQYIRPASDDFASSFYTGVGTYVRF
ncbi:carbohydrate porin [Pseudomonas citronellolis]|uniref:carbohydrate porin n=1 Tax=Pseudomonas citronellolis TaxID=53408 RepID=UPI0023E3CA4F|nr:carbohydrate porin [Pseudomonas citronellolis]MDF3936363.1 carbohydrate porin [Pseudomonas citronellolis]